MESKELVRLYLELAAQCVGVSEVGGNNCGPEVEGFLACMGLKKGNPWCAAAQMYFIKKVEKMTGVKSSIYKSAHCMTIWNKSPKELRLKKPEPGALMIWKQVNSNSGHIGVVEKVNTHTVVTLEGNTSSDSSVNRDGDGFHRKLRYLETAGKLQIVGWLKVF
jgi:hypothetical protein